MDIDAINKNATDESVKVRLLEALTDRVEKGEDYHQVHPDGDLTRGQVGDVCYEQVLRDGEVVFTVAVKGNLLGQFYSEDVWAIVNLDTDTIVEGRNLPQVADAIREQYQGRDEVDDIHDGDLIVDDAHNEAACPRWGMSW